jgi:hypothetical protein
MKVKWRQDSINRYVEGIAVERLVDAGEILRDEVKTKLKAQFHRGWVGKQRPLKPGRKRPNKPRAPRYEIDRPKYKSGPYNDAQWTARYGKTYKTLIKSVRLVRKLTPKTKALSKKRSVRVYAGHYLAFYADIFEYYRPFFRPALRSSNDKMKGVLGVKSGSFDITSGKYFGQDI